MENIYSSSPNLTINFFKHIMAKEPKQMPDIIIVEPKIFGDDRGFFFESYQADRYAALGIPKTFIQDNASRSAKNVLRGLHYQSNDMQGKLIYVTSGKIFDVAVDIRLGSPTFGNWAGLFLDDINHKQAYIPPGFAHGFCVLSDHADFCYKCTNYYDAPSEITIQWNDPAIGLQWPIDKPILSEKDKRGVLLNEISVDQLPKYYPKK